MAKASKSVLAIAADSALTLTQHGEKVRKFNSSIEKIQIDLMRGKFGADERVSRAQKELDKIKANEEIFKSTKTKSAANWQPLADLYNRTLAHITEEHFVQNASIKAANWVKRNLPNGVGMTDEQRKLVADYHEAEARSNFAKIDTIRVILAHKGLVKKAEPVLPTEEQIKELAD